jgi:hypothetical protein
VYCSFIQQGFARFESNPEPKLRVFNIVDPTAPIVRACCAADLSSVRSLFASGLASPFDRIWGDRSLLDLLLVRIISTTNTREQDRVSSEYLSGLVAIFDLLVQNGLDPGIPRANDDRYGDSPLGAIAMLSETTLSENTLSETMGSEEYFLLTNLARTVIKNSIHQPISETDLVKLVWREKFRSSYMPLFDLLCGQEEWPIPWPADDDLREVSRHEIREKLSYFYPEHFIYDCIEIIRYHPDSAFVSRIMEDCGRLDQKCVILGYLACHDIKIENIAHNTQKTSIESEHDYASVDGITVALNSFWI